MKNTLFNHQIRHQSTPSSADSIYIKQQSATREAYMRLFAGFSAACSSGLKTYTKRVFA
jgi:hypothetical protein